MEGNGSKKPKGDIMKSYIQMQFRKTKKVQPKEESEQQSDVPDRILDSSRLSRYHKPGTSMQTIRKEGQMYTKGEKGGLFACFTCTGRRTNRVLLENRILTVRSNSGGLIESLNFDTCSVEIKKSGDVIKVLVKSDNESKPKQFYLEASAQEDISQWETSLRRAMHDSLGQKHSLNYITGVPSFWEVQSVPESEFERRCNSGDLILFRSTHGFAKLQRGFTGSQYDHIALVLRSENGNIVLFESNSDTGVAITQWKDMVRYKWYQAVQRVVYRELKVERSEAFLLAMQDFVKYNLQNKFKLNLHKLMTFTSKAPPTKKQQLDQSLQDQQRYKLDMEKEYKDRSYFCSELIAKCYKALGLLVTDKSSTQYWPVDFTQAKELSLSNGSLGPEELICFDKELCSSSNRHN